MDNKNYETQDIQLEQLFDRKKRQEIAKKTSEKRASRERERLPLSEPEVLPPESKRKSNQKLSNILIYSGIGLLAVLCVIIGIMIVTSNSGGGIVLKGISFDKSTLELRVGKSDTLTAVAEPSLPDLKIVYSSSDESIAKIDNSGLVTAVKEGSADISASYGDVKAVCRVTVTRDIIKEMSVSPAIVTVGGGQSRHLTVKYEPADASEKEFEWKSENPDIALVNDEGLVKGIGFGETNIIVTEKLSGKSCSVAVIVSGAEMPQSIEFDRKEVNLDVNDTANTSLIFNPTSITERNVIYTSSDEDVATVDENGKITAKAEGRCTITAVYQRDESIKAEMTLNVIDPFIVTVPPEESSTPSEDRIQVINGVTYVDGILIANKTYSLPESFMPGEDEEAVSALNKLFMAGSDAGFYLYTISGFRPYDMQYRLYWDYVETDGQEEADRYSARPGYSEHQTGLAFDLNSLEESFGETPEGIWLAENCYKYGFIIRYPKDKEDITGYLYEPWHVRYLGEELAEKVYDSGLTLEEYLGITSQYSDEEYTRD